MVSIQRYKLQKANHEKSSAKPALMRSTTLSQRSTMTPSPLSSPLAQTDQSEDFRSTWPKKAGTNELTKRSTILTSGPRGTSETTPRGSMSARGPVTRKSYKLPAATEQSSERSVGDVAFFDVARSVLLRSRHPSLHGQTLMPGGRKSVAISVPEESSRRSLSPKKTARLAENLEVIDILEAEIKNAQEPSFSQSELSILAGKRPQTTSMQHKSSLRYKGGQTGVWSMIIDNAAIEASTMRRKRVAEEREAQLKAYEESQAALAKAGMEAAIKAGMEDVLEGKTTEEPQLTQVPKVRQKPTKERNYTMVVLVFHRPCSPLSLNDLDVMRRARNEIYTFDRSFVVGGIIVPMSNERILKYQGPGSKPLPFNLRVDAARKAIEQAEMSSWLAVDTCEEGCLASAPGNVVDYIRDYTRSQLFTPGIGASVLEVFSEDALQCFSKRDDRNVIRVPLDSLPSTLSGVTTGKIAPLLTMRSVIVEVPKQARCEELLQASVRALQSGQDPVQPGDTLRRLLGSNAAEVLLMWAAKAQGTRGTRIQNGSSRLQHTMR
eukprot:TRINITY_DN74709_c0_g1_i1.p1 TRINITY_DN74709_c0_g1~~TRINITY_DN74709_c0_g1_i1.p1  ORF type:complete len:549 (-),score=86.41 TRINITY_DN74709_c0_g1_i1:42-1688(-)